jgi:geranylgeranyl diphosphate synthase type I
MPAAALAVGNDDVPTAVVIEVLRARLAEAPVPLAGLFSVLDGALEAHLAPGQPPVLAMELPLLVRGAIDGRPEAAVPIAVAATCLFLAFDLLDDLQDGDERPWWPPYSKGELLLAAAALPPTLPLQTLLGAATDDAAGASLVSATASGLAAIAEGQARDLAGARLAETTPEEAERAVAGKSGAQMALYARLAALHAGCGTAEAERFAAFAHALVSAGQIGSDLADLFDADWSRDLASGARTLPIAFALSRLHGAERQRFEARLGEARSDRKAQDECVRRIRATGAVPYALLRIGVYRHRARLALADMKLREPWLSRLLGLLDPAP